MRDNAIVLKNVSKDYNIFRKNIHRIAGLVFGRKADEVKHALKNISLEVKEGERIVVLGVADSGCSTLLSIIAGVTNPTKGKAKTTGRINGLLNSNAGFDNEFTCRENIYLKGNVCGVPKDVLIKHEEEILKFAEAEKYADLPMKRAPRGTAVRMALAIHQYVDTDIFVIDESFTSGGVDSRHKCENLVKEYLFAHPHVTAIITTSRLHYVQKVCTKGIILKKGEIVFSGTAEETCRKYKYEYQQTDDKRSTVDDTMF